MSHYSPYYQLRDVPYGYHSMHRYSPTQQSYSNKPEGYSVLQDTLVKLGYNEAKNLLQSSIVSMVAPMMEKITQKVAVLVIEELRNELLGPIQDLIKMHTEQTKGLINSYTEQIQTLTKFVESTTDMPSVAYNTTDLL